ncbi:hypothetical protein QT238_17805 [Geobacillus stearothermophilus]|nr:hypothetical protein QT238_17805 [Geobacillus stearothermophilus]
MLEYLLWPISTLFKSFFDSVPFYHGKHIQFYFFILLIILYIIKSKGKIPKLILTQRWVIFLGVLFIIQFCAMLISSYRIDIIQYDYNIIRQYIALIVFILSITIYYFGMRLTINSYNAINKFLRGGKIALIFALVVSYIQLFYIFFPNIFEVPVNFIASTIEARWGPELPGEEVHRFYVNGSYVETTQRVNGLTEEASTNALFLSIIFAPFLVSSVKNRFNIFTQRESLISIYVFLALILIILAMSKTSLGLIMAALILLLWFREASIIRKLVLLAFILLLPLIFYGYGNQNLYFGDIFSVYLNKIADFDVASTANRFGNTLALIQTIKENLFIGVGRGYLDYYIFKNMPEWATHNFEYNIFVSSGWFPVLSSIFGLLAEYGVVFFIYIAFYIKRLIQRWHNVSLNLSDTKKQKIVKTLADALVYYILLGVFGLFFSLDWFASVYIVIFFFFVSTLSFIERESLKFETSNPKKN